MPDGYQTMTEGVPEYPQVRDVAGARTRMADSQIALVTMRLLRVFSARAAQGVTLLMAFALFAWAAWDYSHGKLGTAGLFTAMVHLPAWFGRKDGA